MKISKYLKVGVVVLWTLATLFPGLVLTLSIKMALGAKQENSQRWSGVTTLSVSQPAFVHESIKKQDQSPIPSAAVYASLESVVKNAGGALLYSPGSNSLLLGVLDSDRLYNEHGRSFFETPNDSTVKAVRYQRGSVAATDSRFRQISGAERGPDFESALSIFGARAHEVVTLNAVPLGSGSYTVIAPKERFDDQIKDVLTSFGFAVFPQTTYGRVGDHLLSHPVIHLLFLSIAFGLFSIAACVSYMSFAVRDRLVVMSSLGATSLRCATLVLRRLAPWCAAGSLMGMSLAFSLGGFLSLEARDTYLILIVAFAGGTILALLAMLELVRLVVNYGRKESNK